MSKNVRTEAVDHLFDAILSLENKEECYKFFEDVCTVNELLAFSQRYEVAKMLREQRTYLDIAEKTGASTATISRVNRSLNYGCDGYDMVFARTNVKPLEEEKKAENKITQMLKKSTGSNRCFFPGIWLFIRSTFFRKSFSRKLFSLRKLSFLQHAAHLRLLFPFLSSRQSAFQSTYALQIHQSLTCR